MHVPCHYFLMLTYQAADMADAIRLARLIRDEQSTGDVAAGASRFLNRPISRDYVRRLEGKAPAIHEDHADPMVIRAIAAHLGFPTEQLSPRAAVVLRKQGIPDISPEQAQNWKEMRSRGAIPNANGVVYADVA